MITREERANAYQKANDGLAEIYGSVETALFLGSIQKKYSIPKGPFTHHVGDTLLKLKPRNTFEQGLVSEVSLSPEVARSVSQDLKSFFDRAEGIVVPDANIESKERLQLRPDAKDPTRPLTREEVMSALGGKRTMAQDIEAARLKHEANKVAVPPPPPPHP